MGQQPSQPIIQCDAECERQKRINQLKSTYTTSVKDETKDSAEVRQARKQYYTYAFGEGKYDALESEALAKVADANIKNLKQKHDELIDEIDEEKANLRSNKIALKNMQELLDKYRASNNKIVSSLDKQEATLETARRDVWYTNQRMDRLNSYGNIINIILRVMLIIAIIFFIYDKKFTSLGIVILVYLLIMHFL
jgi:chromosome segregation ATPase